MSGTTDLRPDPDAMIARLRDGAMKRGRLKVFFGAAPGVGKTFAMLEEGRRRAGEGLDVLVGYAEPHSRAETESQLIGLEVLRNRAVEHRGVTLREFDLDAALARRPHLLLIDELAHTNAPGSRHPKRYQDVLEVLDAGIDVYTTVNVQHVESLNDVVERVTGIRVRETLPDAVLERSDEIELVDTSVDELLERLGEGKIYAGDAAERASKGYFNRGNLTALRELALRTTAERVGEQMGEQRRGGIAGRAGGERLLVCVSPSPLSARLVRATKRLAAGLRVPWVAASVETPAAAVMSVAGRERVNRHLDLARRLGAEVVTLSGTGVADAVLEYARAHGISKVVVGNAGARGWRRLVGRSVVDELMDRAGEIDVYVVRGQAERDPPVASASAPPRATRYDWAGHALAALATALAAGAGWAMVHTAGLSNVNVLMPFLLGVMAVAVTRGRGPAVTASALGVAAFDFCFVPPFLAFAVSDKEYLFTFAAMLMTGLTIAELAARLRRQAELARARERAAETLNVLGTRLARLDEPAAIADTVRRLVADQFAPRGVSVLLGPPGRAEVAAGDALDDKELAVARWAQARDEPAGAGTGTLPSAAALHQPMAGRRGVVGVIAVTFADRAQAGDAASRRLLESIAAVSATAVERTLLARERADAQARVDREFLRNTLLSSVSHDLRTPLAAIAGSASTLAAGGPRIGEADRHELAASIYDEARRLERVISNLLETTRLESGGLQLHAEPTPVHDLLGPAVSAAAEAFADHPIALQAHGELPLVMADATAIGQVLANLLENAARHTPPATPIEVVAEPDGDGRVAVSVLDRGPGIAPGDEARLFEKFYRSPGKAVDRRGLGLGLAICRGLVELHGGTIRAFNRPNGGAGFRFTLPAASGTMPAEEPDA